MQMMQSAGMRMRSSITIAFSFSSDLNLKITFLHSNENLSKQISKHYLQQRFMPVCENDSLRSSSLAAHCAFTWKRLKYMTYLPQG